MKKLPNPNLSQLTLLLNNNKDSYISKFIKIEDFIFTFLNHLQEYFQASNNKFKILEPLLDPEIELEQKTIVGINDTEIGEIHLLSNSLLSYSSLVYYSPSGLLEVHILDYEDYYELKISEYIILLNEFAYMIEGEKNLYEKINEIK